MNEWGSKVVCFVLNIGLERRRLSIFPEDSSSIPTSTRQLTTVCYSSPRGSNVFFWPPWTLHPRGAQIYVQANTRTHKIKINKILKNT